MSVEIIETGANGRLNRRDPVPYNVGNAGATGDGQTNDYLAIKNASDKQDSTGAIYFPPGTYRIGTNLTINTHCIFALGATLEPDAGVTVTLAGPVDTAPGQSVQSQDAGGIVTITGQASGDDTLNQRVGLDALVDYYAFGDSYTQGDGASATAKRYVQVFGQAIKSTITNRGIGARGVYRAWRELCVYLPINLRSASLVTLMAGLNDIRRGGADPKTMLKIENCHRAFLALAFAEQVIAASNGSVTQGGTWTVPTLAADGLQPKAGTVDVAGTPLQAVAGGNTLTYTFTNDNLVIWPWVSDGTLYTYGSATITIDGVVVETFDANEKTDGLSDNDNDNGRVPTALVYTGLGSGSHTVVVTPTDATNPFIVDCFGHLIPPENAQPVIVAGPPYLLAATYGSSAPSNNATPELITAVNDAIREVCREFAFWPVRFFPVSAYFDKNNDADGIHPDDAGHRQIAQGFLAQIQQTVKSAYRGVGAQSTAIGYKAQATGAGSIGVGESAVASNGQAAAFGFNANASGSGGHAIGIGSDATGAASTAVGYLAQATGNNSAALGKDATASGSGSTAVGVNASATHNDSTAVGKDAATTKINQVVLGTAAQSVTIPGVLEIVDGMTAPGAATGVARLYVDSADGDFKIVFADGTVKTIVTDT